MAQLQRHAPSGQGTDLAAALGYLDRVQRRGAIIFLISDFLAPDFALPLASLARRHDVVAVSLADAFKREVIAEGVETIAHGTALLQLGCELAQGYGIARPMQPELIPAWVTSWQPDAAWLNREVQEAET